MGSMKLTWRQQVSLALFLFLLLSFLGLFSVFYTYVKITVAEDFSNPNGNQVHPRRVKHTELVLGDAAGKGLAGRVQCTAAANNKAEGAHQSCSLSKTEMVSFVTFFLPSNNELPDRTETDSMPSEIELRNATIGKLDKPFAILSVLFESIQISNPGSALTILTSQNAHIPAAKLPRDIRLARISQNFTRSNLMLQRLESYAYFLGELLENRGMVSKNVDQVEHIVFMDADIIVVGDLRCLFETFKDFNVALTFRNNRNQPINSGFIAIRGEKESLSRARTFLLDVVETYKERFAEAARMLGDQLSLASVVQKHSEKISLRFKKPTIFKAQISQVWVLFLPSQTYNWTPSEGAGQFHGMPKDVKVLHFKGTRKRLMLEAWILFKQSGRNLLDMQCLILRSGRTKYDF